MFGRVEGQYTTILFGKILEHETHRDLQTGETSVGQWPNVMDLMARSK